MSNGYLYTFFIKLGLSDFVARAVWDGSGGSGGLAGRDGLAIDRGEDGTTVEKWQSPIKSSRTA